MPNQSNQRGDCCAYCTSSLEGQIHVYRHERDTHPAPRPAFCSPECRSYYDNRRVVEFRTFAPLINGQVPRTR